MEQNAVVIITLGRPLDSRHPATKKIIDEIGKANGKYLAANSKAAIADYISCKKNYGHLFPFAGLALLHPEGRLTRGFLIATAYWAIRNRETPP